ncbi:zona pellucida sperm-binding protein 4-like [Protopterus annectens]|uniref:zona pellucida sperm-binding protein 4-like n=1 Tax=Protopterus annectens TaxID=7888 RepID=UPI001CFA7D10|nr:zona pellucida sperm-binding protein 4-like [Protopterus annectens]
MPMYKMLVWLLCCGIVIYAGIVQANVEAFPWLEERVYKRPEFIDYPNPVNCSETGMSVTVPSEEYVDLAVSFLIRDWKTGMEYEITDIPSGCLKPTVSKSEDGLILWTTYNGCFVRMYKKNYILELTVRGVNSTITVYERLTMKCRSQTSGKDPESYILTDRCTVEIDKRIPCGIAEVNQVDCESSGCCYDFNTSQPCYYGNEATIHCTEDGFFAIAISKDVTKPPLNLDSIRMAGKQGCNVTDWILHKTTELLILRLPFSPCGTAAFQNENTFLYEMQLVADQEVLVGESGSITRDSIYRLDVRCLYNGKDIRPLKIGVNTLAPPPPVTDGGPLHLELRVAKESLYHSYYTDDDYPVVKVLQDPVFFEVRILQRTDPNVVLKLENCWATPVSESRARPQWNILVDGCPYTGDNYLTQLLTVDATSGVKFPRHYQRFIVYTFVFLNHTTGQPLEGEAYFHCSASACYQSARESCETCSEQSSRKKRERRMKNYVSSIVTADGPVLFISKENVDQGKGSLITPAEKKMTLPAVFLGAACIGIIALVVIHFQLCRQHRLKPKKPTRITEVSSDILK